MPGRKSFESLPIQYVTTQQDCEAAIDQLSKQQQIAVDIEFDRDRRYYGFNLALVQVGSQECIYLFDPLCGYSLQPLFRFLEDPAVQIIMHCPGEDIRLLHSLKCFPKNMYDTEVCAKLLNYPQTSLSQLLLFHFEVALDKKLQTSDWLRRPLTPNQLEYAAMDVRFLIPLYNQLRSKIINTTLERFVAEEQNWLNEEIRIIPQRTDFLKPTERSRLSPFNAYVLNGMFQRRDEVAREKNQPAHFVLSESLLRDVVDAMLLGSQTADLGLNERPSMQNRLKYFVAYCEKLMEEATELSKQLPRRPQHPSGWSVEYLKEVKQNLFLPIRHWIEEKVGSHAVKHILSSNTIDELAKRNITLASIRPDYKKALILQAARELKLDMGAFLTTAEGAVQPAM